MLSTLAAVAIFSSNLSYFRFSDESMALVYGSDQCKLRGCQIWAQVRPHHFSPYLMAGKSKETKPTNVKFVLRAAGLV